MPIRPILLKGHSRPLTTVKFNRAGDLLFTCAKDNKPNVWYADNGERLGTYNGHNGTVWDVDINWESTRIITGSADQSAKLWELQTGKEIYSFPHKSGVRSVAFSHGETLLLTAQDSTFGSQPTIFVYNLEKDITQQSATPVRSFSTTENRDNIIDALWGSLNSTIISAGYDGAVRLWDVETGKEIRKVVEHKKQINNIQFSKDHSMIISASSDHTAKIFDARTLEVVKSYQSDRPLNSAAISPLMNHVIVGGGQEAMNVTITSAKVGHFEVDFFHLVYQEFLGSVKGHFGPVNTVAFSPTGKAFASGAEDGYIRLHHFDKEYFNPKNNY